MRVSFGNILLLVIGAAAVAGGGVLVARGSAARAHFADADDARLVATGAQIYVAHCAQCHGAHLEGQPNWQTVGADGRVRAPPQDETGHTWMHNDEQLFRFVKFSMADIAAPGYVSPMPAFDGQLSDADIAAVLAYIKHGWPTGVRVYQAMLNPGRAGLPAAAAGENWHLPADCGVEPNSLPAAPVAAETKP
jgi:S-disulfanyl-L-cysteine oxidoreductase SoxD